MTKTHHPVRGATETTPNSTKTTPKSTKNVTGRKIGLFLLSIQLFGVTGRKIGLVLLSSQFFGNTNKLNTKKDDSYLPPYNLFDGIWRSFGGIWRSFGGAAYWMVCNSCLRGASPLAKPASTQSQ